MADVYVNYDCSLSSQNLYERLVKLLCKQAFPVNGVLNHSHTIAFRCLVSMFDDMKRRSKLRNKLKFDNGIDKSEILSEANRYTKQKLVKRRYAIAAGLALQSTLPTAGFSHKVSEQRVSIETVPRASKCFEATSCFRCGRYLLLPSPPFPSSSSFSFAFSYPDTTSLLIAPTTASLPSPL
eukprot:762727-Hanusia_phi.AAC.2